MAGHRITLDDYFRAKAMHPELTDWAVRNKQRGGIIEIVVRNETGTLVDLLEYDLNAQGEKYLNADRTAGVQSWARGVTVERLPLEMFG